MENLLIESYTENQRLAIIAFLRLIAEKGDKACHSKRLDYINSQMVFFEIQNFQWQSYLNKLRYEVIQKDIQTISKQKIDFLLILTIEILTCSGNPSENDFQIAETYFINVTNLKSDEFHQKLNELAILTIDLQNYANGKKNDDIAQSNNRLHQNIQNSKEPLFTFNDILFVGLVGLAIIGLISMCK